MNLQQLQRMEDVLQEKTSDINIDDLPSQWKVVKLSNQELFAFENGLWTGKKEPFVDCPVIRNTNFSNDGSLNLSNVAIIPIEQRQLEKKRLISGDIIIERSGGGPQQPVGRVVFFDLTEGSYCFSNFTTRMRVIDKAVVDPRYLHLYLLYFHNSGQTERLQNRTTGIRNLAFEDYKNSSIPLPPITQQHAIVKVLQIVQEAIQARRDELDLERERKVALMEHLFTNGTRGELTKQTEIGEIPQSWEVVRLGAKCNIRYGLGQPPALDDNGVPMIRATDIKGGRIVSSTVVRVKREAIPEKRNPFLKKGDIIVVRSGAYTGDVAMYDGRWELAIAGYDLVATPASHEIDMAFITQYLQGNAVQAYFRRRRDRSAQPHLNADQLSNTIIPFPTFIEQCDISDMLNGCDNKIASLEKELSLLEELFRALLEELLTGRLSTLPLIEKRDTHE